jgi:hypothetical protein
VSEDAVAQLVQQFAQLAHDSIRLVAKTGAGAQQAQQAWRGITQVSDELVPAVRVA